MGFMSWILVIRSKRGDWINLLERWLVRSSSHLDLSYLYFYTTQYLYDSLVQPDYEHQTLEKYSLVKLMNMIEQ